MSPLGCFYGVCRLPVSRFWRVSLSLVSWCLSYFALHFEFVACVAYRLLSWRVSPSGCLYGVCRLQVVFTACFALQLAISSVSPSGCFLGVCRLQVVFTAFVAFRLFLRRVSPSGEPFLACVAFTLISWCLSYFVLHLVFIARVAYNLPRHVPP